MSNINLLPWRDEFKKQKKKDFFGVILLCAIVILGALYIGKMYVDSLISSQQARNKYLQEQTLILDQRIAKVRKIKAEKKELQRRIKLIKQLEKKRNYSTQLLNMLVDITPGGVYLNRVTFSDEKINVKGLSESNNRLAKMMRNIDGSGWLGDSYLSSIVAGPTKPIKLSKFAMRFRVVPEKKGAKNGLK